MEENTNEVRGPETEEKEMRSVSRRKKRRGKILAITIAAFVVLLAAGVGALLIRFFFVVRNVEIQETTHYTPEQLLAAAEIEEGTPLVSLNKQEIASRFDSRLDLLSDVRVTFKLPWTVSITYREAYGEFCVCIGSETYAVEGDLSVLRSGVPSDDPERITLLCHGIDTCIVGEKMTFSDHGLEEMIPEIIGTLEAKSMRRDVQILDLRDKFNIKLRYLDRFDVVIGEIENLSFKLDMLRKVTETLENDPEYSTEGQAAGTIDLTDANTAYYNSKYRIDF